MIRLGVNVDHVATVRQARRIDVPDPVEAALLAEKAGADGITVHLREDRRHIQESDVERLCARIKTKMNLEMGVTRALPKKQPQNLRLCQSHCINFIFVDFYDMHKRCPKTKF